MYEGFLEYGIPMMIGLVFVNFVGAWVLSAVEPPERFEREQISGWVNPDWRDLDAGPEGVRRNIFEKIEPHTKSVG
jgi:hypothetical protein